jgi:hypothetical protein
MQRSLVLLGAAAMAVVPGLAGAQSILAAPVTEPSSALTCADFRHRPDGSWSPLREIIVTSSGGASVNIVPGASLARAASIGGIDLATLLDRQCAPR